MRIEIKEGWKRHPDHVYVHLIDKDNLWEEEQVIVMDEEKAKLLQHAWNREQEDPTYTPTQVAKDIPAKNYKPVWKKLLMLIVFSAVSFGIYAGYLYKRDRWKDVLITSILDNYPPELQNHVVMADGYEFKHRTMILYEGQEKEELYHIFCGSIAVMSADGKRVVDGYNKFYSYSKDSDIENPEYAIGRGWPDKFENPHSDWVHSRICGNGGPIPYGR